ncbi:hypothetical protein II898_04755 [bacterium]|nr:hypothetical protein [bacterium]
MPKIIVFLTIFIFSFALLPQEAAPSEEAEPDKAAEETAPEQAAGEEKPTEAAPSEEPAAEETAPEKEAEPEKEPENNTAENTETAAENAETPEKEGELQDGQEFIAEEEPTTDAPLVKIQQGKPVKYFELYGYFNVANTFSYNMKLSGNNPYMASRNTINNVVTDETTGERVTRETNEHVLNWAWLKLHLEPVINIAETMEIHTKLSIFGNTAMGADNYEFDKKENGLLHDAQLSTSANIVFEGLWGVFDTPIGQLKVGRMPFHWGLGILYSDGNQFNTLSSGNYLDRLQLTIPVMGFKIIPAFDLASTGLLDKYHDYFIDASQKDDGFNVSLMFTMQEDDPAVLENKILNEKTVVEVGAMVMFSWKNTSSGEWAKSDENGGDVEPTSDHFVDPDKVYAYTGQGAKLWKLDAWLNLHYKIFSLKTELAFLTGTIGKVRLDDGREKSVKTQMVGWAADLGFRVIPKKFHIGLLTGIASPDDADYVQGDSWSTPGNSINNSSTKSDRTVENFRFNKDYNFNSALWNNFLGRFTAGYYASLTMTYFFLDTLKGYVGTTYSMALKENNSLGGKGLPNAIEPFIGIDYANKSGMRLGTRYQIGVPFSGLDTDEHDTSLFHYLNVYLGVVF